MANQPGSEHQHCAGGVDSSHTTDSPSRGCHTMLWDCILKDYEWLDYIAHDFSANPFLVSTRLGVLPSLKDIDTNCESMPMYAALLSGDISGDVKYTKDLFFSCLQPHEIIQDTEEILFKKGVILNVADILNCPELIPVDVQRLLYDGNELRSTYSFWRDVQDTPRRLEPPSLRLTASRIPGHQENFWILKISPRGIDSEFEILLEDSKSSNYGLG